MMKKKWLKILAVFTVVLIVAIFSVKITANRNTLYKVTYLPSLGGQFTLAWAINDNGQVAGFSEISSGAYHMFIWDSATGMRDLGQIHGSPVSINNFGQIAATAWDPNDDSRAIIWNPGTGRHMLPTLGGKTSRAADINNKGQVLGVSETAVGITHSFIWDDEKGIIDLTPSSAEDTSTSLINDKGQVVLHSENHYFLVETNDVELEFTQIPNRINCDINNNGYVFCIAQSGQDFDAFTWHPVYGKNDIAHIENKTWGFVYANDINQVVVPETSEPVVLLNKQIFSARTKNYLYDPNLGKIYLDQYVSLGWGESFFVTDINNKGQIAGVIQSAMGHISRGVLLEPVEANFKKLRARRKVQTEK